jgi:hypothetical protein
VREEEPNEKRFQSLGLLRKQVTFRTYIATDQKANKLGFSNSMKSGGGDGG